MLTSPPLRLGSPAQFASVREFFRRAHFDEATLCHVLGMEDMSDLGRVCWEKVKLAAREPPDVDCDTNSSLAGLPAMEREGKLHQLQPPVELADRVVFGSALQWCLQVFIRGLAAAEEESWQICRDEVLTTFLSLGLLRRAINRPGFVVCPVWVYPADGLVMVSDRRDDPEGGSLTPTADVVFPAIYAGTLRFLRLLPLLSGGEALDLCGGSGIGALHLSRTARAAVTADITERSALFAEFNARLNGLAVESLCGDLYGPVPGKQFDLISAHPPFVPATGPNMVYRDAGDTGEAVTRRIIEGLPAHLRDGGTCVILCVARDTPEQTFEQRARAWLGASADEFDLVFGLEKILEIEGVVDSMRKRSQHMTNEEADQLLARLRSLGTRQFVYGALFIRRCARLNVEQPLRICMTPMACSADFERLLAWRHHRRQPGFNQWLARSRPRLAPALELTVRHIVHEGQLTPAEFVFSIHADLEAALRLDAWVVPLVARLEGKRSVAEIFQEAHAASDLPQGFALDDFLGLVQGMIEHSFLQVDLP
jgi:SAM-dependent methyltransferase